MLVSDVDVPLIEVLMLAEEVEVLLIETVETLVPEVEVLLIEAV